MALLFVVLLPLALLALPILVERWGRSYSAWAAALITAAALGLALHLSSAVFAGNVIQISWAWIDALNLRLSFRMDGLGLLFTILILGIGLLIILYARYYLSRRDPMGRFYSLLLLFMGAMLGIVLSDNILLLLMFWELTSLASFLLIGYWHYRSDARQGARMALAVTGGGGLALMAGLLLLGHMAGSYELSVILERGDAVRAHALYLPMLLLVLLGAFTKSAQFPFHFWLPSAMAAPTPVSAYLHSATMVKAGVFLLARLFPVLAGTDEWFFIVGGTGLITLLLGAYFALFKHDLKGLLAYSTVSNLGLITLLFGMGTPLAAVAGVFHIVNHAIFKASLFMAAGIIDHEAGTRDMRKLNGLLSYMPHTATLAMISAASMAGVPLFNGFLSKEMFFSETVALARLGTWAWILPTAATLAGVFVVAYSLRFIHDVFFNGEPIGLPKTPHEPPRYMKVPVEILAALCLLLGVLPGITVGPLLHVAAASTVAPLPLPEYSLNVWHGLSLPLLMSLVAFAAGILLYSQRHHLFALHQERLPRISTRLLYNRLVDRLFQGARWITDGLENGSLQRYLALLVGTTLVLGAAPFVSYVVDGRLSSWSAPGIETIDTGSVIAWSVLAVAAVATAVLHRRRLTAVVLLGVVGLIVVLAFARFSAPDLALTQISVEIVTTILMLLALYFLPQESPRETPPARRFRDIGLALLAGLGAAGLTLAVLVRPLDSISHFHLAQSLPGGGGANVVNVILVDFRGFDTMGEIVVLAIAALGIFALLGELRMPFPTANKGRPWARDRYPLILAIVTRLLLPLALVVSAYLFLRGHNQPGGGFVAAIVTSVALIMQYLGSGTSWTQQRFRLRYRSLIAFGLLIALLTGAGSWVFGEPFLTSAYVHLELPLIGEFELASAMLFDLGVYLTVVGSVTLILARLGRISGSGSMRRSSLSKGTEQWKS